MADISQITLPSGTTYNLKDAWARTQIEAITGGSAIVFKGVSSTALTDGGNENPTVGGSVITSKSTGDLYFYGSEEFIYGDDNKWHSLGDSLANLGELAYKDSVTVKYDKTTSVTSSFSGAQATVSISATNNNSGNYTPAGTVTGGVFTGSDSTFTGSYTPAGSVAAPTISVSTAGSTTTIKNPTSSTVAKTVETATPSSTVNNELTYYNVANQNLTLYKIGYTTGDSITTSNVTVKTGDASYQSSSPSFTGTASTVTVNGTPEGSVSGIGFSGTKVQISGTVTPSGTVTSTPNNTNTNATVTYN